MSSQITYSDVATAAEQLRAAGRPVGSTKVREMLGRGSFTTIQKYLAEWETAQADLKAKTEAEKRSGPPEEMFTELQKVMTGYWPHAVARAKEELRPETEALTARLNEAFSRIREATVEIGNLENALEAASVRAAKRDEAEKRAAEANLKIIALQGELSRLEKIESRFEGHKELIATLQDQAKTLKEQNALLTKKADEFSAALTDMQRRLEAATVKAAKMEEAERRAADALQKISTLQTELSRLEKVEARSEAQIKNLEEQNAALLKKTDSLSSELSEARTRVAKLEAKLESPG